MTAQGRGRSSRGRNGSEIVKLLEVALAPVEPRAELGDELARRLTEVQHAALVELADWELAAMRDPRNWVRPAAAVAVGSAAGAALLILRMRQAQRRRAGIRGLAEQSRRELLEAISAARARLP